ncbi:unnamed protein product [Allacma fusca]|uniref:HotDog ACOT-type domain-containing protein n=1 Tax=Allacma fusca TaxID=39272 RepID=A0A8J2LE60_9HEXA|nr:unnamed protein product [Allacma fusca]
MRRKQMLSAIFSSKLKLVFFTGRNKLSINSSCSLLNIQCHKHPDVRTYAVHILSNKPIITTLPEENQTRHSFHTSSKLRGIYIKSDDNTPTVAYSDISYCKALEIRGGYNPTAYENLVKDRMKDIEKFPKDRLKLPDRRMKDSFAAGTLTPGKDEMRDSHYVDKLSPYSHMLGLVDIFASYVSSLHLDIPSFDGQPVPYAFVALMLDHLRFNANFEPGKPIRLSAHVSKTGRSSVEIDGEIDQLNSIGQYRTIATCAILTAARMPDMKSPAIVNQIIPGNDAEQSYLDTIKHRSLLREMFLKDVAGSLVPRVEHVEVLNQLKSANKSKSVSIESTKNVRVFETKAQNRNTYYTTFGGFVLATAEATAFEAATTFSESDDVWLYHVGHARFLSPIPIGNHLKCEAVVVAEVRNPHLLHVAVTGESIHPGTNTKEIAVAVHFVYKIDKDLKVPFILPRDDYEIRLKINGLRFLRFLHEPDLMYPNPYQM